jgi:tetratricopeptide (TPR) repeat protein
MRRARSEGKLVSAEADFQLHLIYLWYEKDPRGALQLISELATRHPRNPLFGWTAAEIHDTYLHDPVSSASAYEQLLGRARRGQVEEAALAEMQARLGLARLLETLYESDRALRHAQAVIEARPSAPYGAVAEAWWAAGRAQLHLGHTDDAAAAFAQALARAPADDALDVRTRVRSAQKVPVDAKAAAAYRTALDGWRAFERKAYAEAEARLAHAVDERPTDMVTRHRYGRVLHARGRNRQAQEQWEAVVGAGATTPAFAYADACVALATLLEPANPARARLLYERAAATFGASADTRAAARRHATRLAETHGLP